MIFVKSDGPTNSRQIRLLKGPYKALFLESSSSFDGVFQYVQRLISTHATGASWGQAPSFLKGIVEFHGPGHEIARDVTGL